MCTTSKISNKKTYNDLVLVGRKNELVTNLKIDQVNEVLNFLNKLSNITTTSRRIGNIYKINDYYYYFTRENETAYEITEKIGINKKQLEYHSKLLLNVNESLWKCITKKDIKKYKTLNFLKDTPLLLPYAVPDKYIKGVRECIPVSIRNIVWNTYCNIKTNSTKCYVCNCNVYNVSNGWDCSHIIPYIICNTNDVDNLRVCCQSCNRKCSTRNLNDFKEEYLMNL